MGEIRVPPYWLHVAIGSIMMSDRLPLPTIRRPFFKRYYADVCRTVLAEDPMTLLNLGYVEDAERFDGDGADTSDRVAVSLYDQIVAGVELAGRTVLEVGCGSGAGGAHVARTYAPASYVGVDLNEHLVAWGTRRYGAPNVRFVQGDAQNLPIASDSIDAVINLESSHCYPSRRRFFEEVTRVLRPGGTFLYADLVLTHGGRDSLERVSTRLADAGLAIEEHIDITANVLAARDVVSRSAFRSQLVAGKSPLLAAIQEDAMFLSGTRSYRQMACGAICYGQWRAAKPR